MQNDTLESITREENSRPTIKQRITAGILALALLLEVGIAGCSGAYKTNNSQSSSPQPRPVIAGKNNNSSQMAVHYARFLRYLDAGRTDLANNEMEAVQLNGDNSTYRLMLAQVNERNKKKAEEISKIIAHADNLQSRIATAVKDHGTIEGQLKNIADAKYYYEKALAETKKDVLSNGIETKDSALRAEIFTKLAKMYWVIGNHDNACDALISATVRNPTNAGLHSLLGDWYLNTGNCRIALNEYARAKELNPGYKPPIAPPQYKKGITPESLEQRVSEFENLVLETDIVAATKKLKQALDLQRKMFKQIGTCPYHSTNYSESSEYCFVTEEEQKVEKNLDFIMAAGVVQAYDHFKQGSTALACNELQEVLSEFRNHIRSKRSASYRNLSTGEISYSYSETDKRKDLPALLAVQMLINISGKPLLGAEIEYFPTELYAKDCEDFYEALLPPEERSVMY